MTPLYQLSGSNQSPPLGLIQTASVAAAGAANHSMMPTARAAQTTKWLRIGCKRPANPIFKPRGGIVKIAA
jgi:hypothetical protein